MPSTTVAGIKVRTGICTSESPRWRAIAKELDIPVMTAVDAYRTCTEIASSGPAISGTNKRWKAVPV
jgi:hypothetical protein